MRKPWSITTTLRNPDRLRSFLFTLDRLNGEDWNRENQEKYQIYLIQDRNYGYGSTQFYNGLQQDQIDLINDQGKEISFDFAKNIFYSKNYKDPSMRGRQSFNPLKKIGLAAVAKGKIKITDNEKELPDFDLLVGGFPCQSFSIAGKRGGFDDTRGTMFFEIARIVREKQPRLLLLENVKGLLSHDKGQTFHTIISTLDELGYDRKTNV